MNFLVQWASPQTKTPPYTHAFIRLSLRGDLKQVSDLQWHCQLDLKKIRGRTFLIEEIIFHDLRKSLTL